jgi:hypothetical protein
MKIAVRTMAFALATFIGLTSRPSVAPASTLEHMSIAKMVRLARVIVRATCVENSTRWQEGEIWTLSKFRTEEAWKGSASPEFTVRLLGGTVGNISSTVSGIPHFHAAEEVVVFLEPTKFGDYSIESWMQGTFRIRRNSRTGEMHVTQDTANFSTFDPASRNFISTGIHGVNIESFRSEIVADLMEQSGEGR